MAEQEDGLSISKKLRNLLALLLRLDRLRLAQDRQRLCDQARAFLGHRLDRLPEHTH
jgi:hypothetical protein